MILSRFWGGNGAGKSTLFNTIAGTLPVVGRFIFWGRLTNYSPEKRAKYLSWSFKILNGDSASHDSSGKPLGSEVVEKNVVWFRVTWPAIRRVSNSPC